MKLLDIYKHSTSYNGEFDTPTFGSYEARVYDRITGVLTDAGMPRESVNALLDYLYEKYEGHPYHNFYHALFVADFCVVAGDSSGVTGQDLVNTVLAALFHDAGHSGGKLTDPENIQEAQEIARVAFQHIGLYEFSQLNKVQSLIKITEFHNRKFTFTPVTKTEKLIRDADLSMCFTPHWPIFFDGLRQEIGIKCTDLEFLKSNVEFLNKCKMYTNLGKVMMNHYLTMTKQAIKEIEKDV